MSGTVREVSLPVREPFAWPELLAFLAARAVPGVEEVGAGRYRRAARLGSCPVLVEVVRGAAGELRVSVRGAPAEASLEPLLARVRHLFDLDAQPQAVATALGRDPALAAWVREAPGLRVPGAWDGFELGVRAILGQQVSVKGASTLIGRFTERFGSRLPARLREGSLRSVFPPPRRWRAPEVAEIGLPAARARCVVELAQAVGDGRLRFDAGMAPAAFEGVLVGIKGIGPWTAQYMAMRARHDRDAFPSGDLALLRVLAAPGQALPRRALEGRAEAWRPWRAYAAMYLWRAYAGTASRVGGG